MGTEQKAEIPGLRISGLGLACQAKANVVIPKNQSLPKYLYGKNE